MISFLWHYYLLSVIIKLYLSPNETGFYDFLQAVIGDIWKGKITSSGVLYNSFKDKDGGSIHDSDGNYLILRDFFVLVCLLSYLRICIFRN